MAFTDFVRGIYATDGPDPDRILKTYMEEMTCEERRKLQVWTFREIWDQLWPFQGRCYHQEYEPAKRKFDRCDIRRLLDATTCSWTQQEYGFPKGRKNLHERNQQCAIREFCEETGYRPHEFDVLPISPFRETFRGTNDKNYSHIYYVARVKDNAEGPRFDLHNIQQAAEIRKISWLTYEQCLAIIRPYDAAKKKVFRQIHDFLKGECCGGASPPGPPL